MGMSAGTDDEELVETVVNGRALEVLIALLHTPMPELVHRAAVGLEYSAQVSFAVARLREKKVKEALSDVTEKHKKTLLSGKKRTKGTEQEVAQWASALQALQ